MAQLHHNIPTREAHDCVPTDRGIRHVAPDVVDDCAVPVR